GAGHGARAGGEVRGGARGLRGGRRRSRLRPFKTLLRRSGGRVAVDREHAAGDPRRLGRRVAGRRSVGTSEARFCRGPQPRRILGARSGGRARRPEAAPGGAGARARAGGGRGAGGGGRGGATVAPWFGGG